MKEGIGGFQPGTSSRFHYEALPEHLKKPYAAIRKAMIDDEPSVTISKPLDIDTCLMLLESVLYDNPQIFWIDLACSLTVGYRTSTIVFQRNRFAKDREKLKTVITRNAREIYDKYIAGCSDAYSIELAVHDVLSGKVAYDGTDKESSHSLVGPMAMKKGVCDGISKAAAFLLNCYGVECSVVSGKERKTGDPHAWNVVRIERRWYNTDVTFDLQKGAGTPIRFFLNMDDEMASRTHIQNTEGRCGSRKQNHYVRNGTYFRSAKDALGYISGYRIDPSVTQDVYDLYVEEECDGRILSAVSMKYTGKAASIRMINSSGRYLVTVRRERDGEERAVRGPVQEAGQRESGEEPGHDARSHDGPRIRREGRQHGMVPQQGRPRNVLRSRSREHGGSGQSVRRAGGEDQAGPGKAQVIPGGPRLKGPPPSWSRRKQHQGTHGTLLKLCPARIHARGRSIPRRRDT